MNYKLISKEHSELPLKDCVFANRKIPSIYHYLNTTDKDLNSPTSLVNTVKGARILIQAIQNKLSTLIVVDTDCDGYTSAALLVNYLFLLFPSFVKNYIQFFFHSGKQHGLTPEVMEQINQYSLIICPDSASNDYEQHKILKEKGKQLIILDHHEADTISEYACVINNQLCDYPNKTLSGVGVVYKFCEFIDSQLKIDNAKNFRDLVALGEIADVMELNDYETRQLISTGLQNINNPFLKTMVKRNSFSLKSDTPTPTGIAFYVAPYVNAVIRMGEMKDKKLLFYSMLDYKAEQLIPSTKRGCSGEMETIVEQICRVSSNIKNKQTSERDAIVKRIEDKIESQQLTKLKILCIILQKDECNPNLTGLVANILADKYKRPVLLLRKTSHDGQEYYEGSGRNHGYNNLESFRNFLTEMGIEQIGGFAQGHASAFGFSCPSNKFSDFLTKCLEALKDFDFSLCYKVDKILEESDVKELLELALLDNIWGHGIEEPKLAFKNVAITTNIVLMSKNENPTLKITLPNGVTCIKFKSSEEEYNKLYTSLGRNIIDIVGRCGKNEWLGQIKPQIIIEDYEIVKTEEYYF